MDVVVWLRSLGLGKYEGCVDAEDLKELGVAALGYRDAGRKAMAQRVIDLSLTIEDNMPAHKLFQRPVITTHMSHESTKALNLGVSGDPMTFQTNFIATLDHVGTHVDAFRHVNPSGKSVDEMPLDLFMGKAVCFDLRHVPDLGEITVEDMERAEAKCGTKVNGHIVLLCTGFHNRNYPSIDSVWKNPQLTVKATRWLHDRGSPVHGGGGPSPGKPPHQP